MGSTIRLRLKCLEEISHAYTPSLSADGRNMTPQLSYAAAAGQLIGIFVILVEGFLLRKAFSDVMIHAATAILITFVITLAAFIGGVKVPDFSATSYATDLNCGGSNALTK
jgi:hypothetical protein